MEEAVEYTKDLYKKFFRTKTASGFLALRPWEETLKVSIDIGEVSIPGNKLVGNTLVWTDMIPLLVYLRTGSPNGPGFSTFGGGMVNGAAVSRSFTIDAPGEKSRWWKTLHMPAIKAGSGAFIPTSGAAPISSNQIKMSREEELEVAYRLDLLMHGVAARNPKWYESKERE